MGIVKVVGKLTEKDFREARKDYKTYIKITIDIENKTVLIGGEYHADAEKLLLEEGSKQDDIWGGGVNLKTKEIETNAMINLRAGKNNSTEIIDTVVRKKFIDIAKKVIIKHV